MADHIADKGEQDQLALATSAETTGARISPRKVLESLSLLRIKKTRIKPLETESKNSGGNADVMPAELEPAEGETCATPTVVKHVAAKKLRVDDDTGDTRVLALLAHEVSLLNRLSHKNIISIIGFVEDTKEGIAWMILPWEKNGNLREFIQSADWEFPERLSLIYDVASGIEYLHTREPPICHGDLKSLNILVNVENQAVLTDFGSARLSESTSEGVRVPTILDSAGAPKPDTDSPRVELAPSGATITLTGSNWTLRWAAPELLNGSLPDLASDIWAFGWICWEVMTSNFPFDGENDVSVVLRIVEGKLPTLRGDGRLNQVAALVNLMIECWSLHPSKRPGAKKCERQVYWMDRTTPCKRNGSEPSDVRSARLLSSLATMHIRHGRMDEAMEHLHLSLKIARSTKDDRATTNAIHRMADVYRLQGEYSKAEESYLTNRDIYTRIGDRAGLASTFAGLGDVHHLRGDPFKAEESYATARDIWSQIGDQSGLAFAFQGLGEAYCWRSEYSRAEESFIAAREIYSRVDDQAGCAEVHRAFGDMYALQSKDSKAEESYSAARDIYSQIGDQRGIAIAVKGLGEIYRSQFEYSKAKESFTTARDIYIRTGNQPGLADSLVGLGDVYHGSGEYDKAEESYIAALDIYTRAGGEIGVSNALSRLGNVYCLRGEFSKAKESLTAARAIYTRNEDQNGLGNVFAGLGAIYHLQGEYEEAEEAYIAARDIFGRIGYLGGLQNAFSGLGQVYLLRGEIFKAQESYIAAQGVRTRIMKQNALEDALKDQGDDQNLQG